jgi:AraC-like DNA-binding protein
MEDHVERYYGKDTLHPAIPALGTSKQSSARPGLQAHRHHTYEVVLLEKGHLDWFIEKQEYALSPDSIFLTHPEETHGSHSGIIQPSIFSWIQIAPEFLPSKLQSIISLPKWKHRVLDPNLRSLIHHMLHEIREPTPSSKAMMEGLLIQFVITLSRCGNQILPQVHSHEVHKVIQSVKSRPTHPWCNEELENISGLHHTQLNERFHQEVGQTARSFALRIRLQEAQRLLRETSLSITCLAYQLGFSNSQHLSSTFRKHYGITPTECRNEKGF